MTAQQIYEREKDLYYQHAKVKCLGFKEYKVKGQKVTIVHMSVKSSTEEWTSTKKKRKMGKHFYQHRMVVAVDGQVQSSLITKTWWGDRA